MICVVGGWHQASVMTACLAELGHAVRGIWPDEEVITGLRAAKPPVHEPGLDALIARHLASGGLRYTTRFAEALDGADLAYLAIDTPIAADDSPELEVVFECARDIGRAVTVDALVLCVSAQVPVGTCAEIAQVVETSSGGRRCAVAYVPEFLRLGAAIETFREADRFVIGCDDAQSADRIAAVYEPLGRPIVRMSVRSAEMAKHASNAFLAASISFINELSNLCEATGAAVDDVARAMKLDRRIGPHAFLSPGLGFAGGTLGRDVRALQQVGREQGMATGVLDAVMAVNAARPRLVVSRLRSVLGELRGTHVAVWGLTYKPGTSTLRRSVALEVVEELVAQGARVRAYDPIADLTEPERLPDFDVVDGPYDAADGADAVVLLTGWPGLGDMSLHELCVRMRTPLLLDTRNAFDAETVAAAGIRYLSVGRGAAVAPAVSAGSPAPVPPPGAASAGGAR